LLIGRIVEVISPKGRKDSKNYAIFVKNVHKKLIFFGSLAGTVRNQNGRLIHE
jgi:hypothetical protein